ncbi:MAG: hypothetical protein WC420_03935 [Candidatus Paceibacterota bacterium]
MIRIGYTQTEKENEIQAYIDSHKIKKTYIFYFKKFKPTFNLNIESEYIEYSDIEMYKFFYRLLEEIDDSSLVVIDECMRTQNRNELIYNCAHHYLNQTEHKIVFEYFPFIKSKEDFMILLDFQNKGKYRGKGFEWEYLKQEDTEVKYKPILLTEIAIPVTEDNISKYEAQKEKLFDELGNKDPDTIPRNLHIWTGRFKKTVISSTGYYIARNSRFKLPNVVTYKEADMVPRVIIDFPHRRLDFNDYLKASRSRNIKFLSTGLPVDNFYKNDFTEWVERVREFAEASLCK